jgi:cellulose synthase/poly-beta-1,6-N-acetylglucosamine synthase-like glycosyltransferase
LETLLAPRELKVPRAHSKERRVICLIPARHEPEVEMTVCSVMAQDIRPDLTVIIVNNNKDDGVTEAAANAAAKKYEAENVIAWHSEPDGHAKAGALNQALDQLTPQLKPDDAIVVMDGDTTLGDGFIEQGLTHLSGDVGGVGAIFVGRSSSSLIGTLQRMEYYRYGREMPRLGHRTPVLTGTGTMFSVRALAEVKAARNAGILLPGGDGYYDVASLTEDNEMTLALRTLGYECLAPGFTTTTDVMETWRQLFVQRSRWFLGALNNLKHYGKKLPWHLKWVYWKQQVGLAVAAFVMVAYCLMLTLALALFGNIEFSAIWLIPAAVALAERVKSVWGMGKRFRWVAASVLIEQLYTMFLLGIFLWVVLRWLCRGKAKWGNT